MGTGATVSATFRGKSVPRCRAAGRIMTAIAITTEPLAPVERSAPATPLELDAASRRDGVTIGTIRDLIPKECHVIDPVRSWLTVLRVVVVMAVAQALLAQVELTSGVALFYEIPALLAAWLFAGWAFTGVFVLGHDCAHMAFSERRWVNSLVGHLCLSAEFTGFHNWRIWHNYHHAKTQLRTEDPDWPEKMLTLPEYKKAALGEKAHVRLGFGTPLGLLVGFWVGMFRRTFMQTMAPQIQLARGAKRELLFSSLFMVASVGAVSYGLVHYLGAFALIKYYYVPSFIAAAHGAMLTYLHHTSADSLVFDKGTWTPLRGQVISTFNVRFPRVIEALWLDINIHLPHHLAPKIPWYNLRKAAEAIAEKAPGYYQERRFSLGYLWASWRRPLLAETAEKGRYTMASF